MSPQSLRPAKTGERDCPVLFVSLLPLSQALAFPLTMILLDCLGRRQTTRTHTNQLSFFLQGPNNSLKRKELAQNARKKSKASQKLSQRRREQTNNNNKQPNFFPCFQKLCSPVAHSFSPHIPHHHLNTSFSLPFPPPAPPSHRP